MAETKKSRKVTAPEPGTPRVYVLNVYLARDRKWKKDDGESISRIIEIRGDQTLEDLHFAIFDAYNRYDEHLYEFQLGKKPFDPDGPSYGISMTFDPLENVGDATTTTIDELDLQPRRIFGYWFDFGDDWYHYIHVNAIEPLKPRAKYPRVVKRTGKSPPQYEYGDE